MTSEQLVRGDEVRSQLTGPALQQTLKPGVRAVETLGLWRFRLCFVTLTITWRLCWQVTDVPGLCHVVEVRTSALVYVKAFNKVANPPGQDRSHLTARAWAYSEARRANRKKREPLRAAKPQRGISWSLYRSSSSHGSSTPRCATKRSSAGRTYSQTSGVLEIGIGSNESAVLPGQLLVWLVSIRHGTSQHGSS
jgi:hypothetical protein